MNIRIASLALVVLVAGGCGSKRELPLQEYLSWIHDPDHGLVQTRRVGDFQLTVKWMPPEYLAYQDMNHEPGDNIRSVDRDSLRQVYERSYTFLVSIEPTHLKHNDRNVLLTGIGSYEEFVDRVIGLNFNSSEYFTLTDGKRTDRPVLAALENSLEASGPRNVIVVFSRDADNDRAEENLDLTFDDPLFNTGKNHFVFSRKAIDNIPKLAL